MTVVVPRCNPFTLLLFHKILQHKKLLLVDLKADVLGDIRDKPVNKIAHEHHHILHGTETPESFHQRREHFWLAAVELQSMLFFFAIPNMKATTDCMQHTCYLKNKANVKVLH
ncbi:hypothetical protein CHARACLAT_023759 [Characodon lateralis]|uniref:Uncharacterized protein n=1 Tax=Characodon lateralis TaxID=208331 RepID=A0ABU7EQ51_9TELE|nr:hypothetical protein [Characodon lateralis]